PFRVGGLVFGSALRQHPEHDPAHRATRRHGPHPRARAAARVAQRDRGRARRRAARAARRAARRGRRERRAGPAARARAGRAARRGARRGGPARPHQGGGGGRRGRRDGPPRALALTGARPPHEGRGAVARRRVLFVFVDGVGLGPADPAVNPLARPDLPALAALLDGRAPVLEAAPYHGRAASLVGLDATLGAPGLPQSGTGQAALLTGRNAAELFGRHFGPWTPTALRPLVERESILARARAA